MFKKNGVQPLLDKWRKLVNNSDKEMLIKYILSSGNDFDKGLDSVCGEEWWYNEMQYHLAKHKESKNQYAFAIVRMTNGECVYFNVVHPDFKKKKNPSISPRTKHSEEILSGQLDTFIKVNGTKVKSIFIYTYNSPCLKRENGHVDNCMTRLLRSADNWRRKYGISTDVGFTEAWGISGKKFFTRDQINIYQQHIPHYKKFEEIPFKLHHKQLADSKELDILRRNKDLTKFINSAVDGLMKLAKRSNGLIEEHLDRGKKKIDSLKFPSQDEDIIYNILNKIWHEMVSDSANTHIQELKITEFNNLVVKSFCKDLKLFCRNMRPFRLYHIPKPPDKQ